MQVGSIAGISRVKPTNSLSINNKNVHFTSSQAENFSNINEISGRYLAFKGAKTPEEYAVDDFIENKINPFLKEYEEISNKNKAIYESSEKLTDIYWRGFRKIENNYNPLMIIEKDPVVVKNLTVPLKYRANLNEYKYLTKPEDGYMMSEETKNFAKEIERQMHNEKLDSYDDALILLKKTMIDIQNGQSNVSEYTSKRFNIKLEGTKQAKDLSLGALFLTDKVSGYKNRYLALQKETNSNVKNKKFAQLNDEIPKLNNLIKYANETLRGRTEEAETLMNYNNLTESLVNEQLERVESRYKKITDKNMNVLHKYMKEHPELKRNASMDERDDKFLKKQEYLNVKLWQHIQNDKNDHNEEGKRLYAEYQAQHANDPMNKRLLDDPDLPF